MRRPSNLVKDTLSPQAAVTPGSDDRQTPTNYLDLYGLSKPPFGNASDQAGYILFGSHRRAFETIVDHLVNGSGLLVIQGAEGIGKTQALRSAAAVTEDSGAKTTVITRPPGGRLDLPGLFLALGHPMGQDKTNDDPVRHFLQPPRKALLIDDVDLMPTDCLGLLWSLLQALPTESGGSAMILTTTADVLSASAPSHLAQIIGVARHVIRLPPLGPAEMRQYLERSLWVSGGTTRRLIAPDAMKLIIAQSGGLPGVVDRLMEAAFTAGYARGDSMITAKTVRAAMGPTSTRPRPRDAEKRKVVERTVQFASVGILLIGTLLFLYRGLVEGPHVVPSATKPPASGMAVVKPPSGKSANPPAALPPAMAASPANQPRIVAPTETLSPALIAALIKRGGQSVELGDIAAARLLFQRASNAGSAAAAVALGRSYDPNYVPTGWADPGRAMEFYRNAVLLGDPHAEALLKAVPPQ